VLKNEFLILYEKFGVGSSGIVAVIKQPVQAKVLDQKSSFQIYRWKFGSS